MSLSLPKVVLKIGICISHMVPIVGAVQMTGARWEVGTATIGRWIVGGLAKGLVAKN